MDTLLSLSVFLYTYIIRVSTHIPFMLRKILLELLRANAFHHKIKEAQTDLFSFELLMQAIDKILLLCTQYIQLMV